MQFPRFRYTVVIGVLPQTQGNKYRVVSINYAIGIAGVGSLTVMAKEKVTELARAMGLETLAHRAH